MLRSSIGKSLLAVSLLAVSLFALGCEDEPEKGEGINRGARLSRLEGKLSFLGNNSNAKVSLAAGKEQIAARIDPATKRFVFDKIPKGPKSLIVKKGGQVFNLLFPKSKLAEHAKKMAGAIPDTNVLNGGKLDLGVIKLVEEQGKKYFSPENNPLKFIDTDADGSVDLEDADLDGDGTDNWEDDSPWGEWDDAEDAWMDEWGWDESYADEWDEDEDGLPDWEEGDAEWIDWDEIPDEDWGFDEDYSLEDYCEEYDDPDVCEGEFDYEQYCEEYGEYDPSCWGGEECDPEVDPDCYLECDPEVDPDCYVECDPEEDPDCEYE